MNPYYQEMPLLSSLPEAIIAETLVLRHYEVGERLFEQDDPTTGLWFVIEGRVAVERVGVDGNLTTTGVWVRGDIVGIAGLWDASGYPASARALVSPTTMGWMPRNVVLRLHHEIPGFGMEISRHLAARLRYVQESLSNRQGRPIVNQLAIVLQTLSYRMGHDISLTHEDLAHIIGTHRETVSRALHELTRQGAIVVRYGEIHIDDPKKLDRWGNAAR